MVIPGPFPAELTLFPREAATCDSRLPEGDVMRNMAVSQDPQATRPSAAVRASILILGILACRPLHASSDPTREASPADLNVRAMVVLKDPGTALRDGDRQLPNRGERLFRVERLGKGFADIATEDGTIRGWVEVDQLESDASERCTRSPWVVRRGGRPARRTGRGSVAQARSFR